MDGPAQQRWAWLTAGAVGGLAVLGAAAIATHGLDRTDEGLYLNAISHPADDRSTLLLFGYAYHPFYALVGGDIVGLRWAGIALSVLIGTYAAWFVLGRTTLVGAVLGPRQRVALGGLVGAATLLPLVGMPLSPGYNSLALQGLLVSTAGVAMALTGRGRQLAVGWVIVGVGGGLTFLGKPTSAAALLVLVLLLAVVNLGRWVWWSPGAGFAAAATVLGVVWTDPASLVRRLAAGLEVSQALGAHDHLIRSDLPFHRASFLAPAVAVVALVGLGLALVSRGRGVTGALAVIAAAVVGAASIVWWALSRSAVATMAQPAALVVLVLLLPLLLPLAAPRPRAEGSPGVDRSPGVGGSPAARRRVSFAVFLVLLPGAYAFGTNLNLWSASGRAGAFWVLAATILLARGRVVVLAPGLAAALLIVTWLAGTVLAPYRYAPLYRATTYAQATSAGASMWLTPEDAARTRETLALGRRLGIGEQTSIVDLTGDSPGWIHALGARAAGQAWILGGYPGSRKATVLALQHDACTLRSAWVLVAPDGARAIDVGVLGELGLSLGRDYVPVGSFRRVGSAWRGPAREDTVQVWRPRGALRVAGCGDSP